MNFNFNPKLSAAGGGLLILLMVFLSGQLYHNLGQWKNSDNKLRHIQNSLQAADGIYSSVVTAESAVRAYAITGRPESLRPFDKTIADLRRQLQFLRLTEKEHPDQLKPLETLADLLKKRQAVFQESILSRRTLGFDAARLRTLTGKGSRLTAAIRAAIGVIQETERGDLKDLDLEARAGSLQRSRLLTIVFLVIFLFILGAFTAVLQGSRKRRKAEEELADAHARLQSVLNSATQVAIIATDLKGTVTLFNTGAENMLGYRAGEMIGRATPAVIHLAAEMEARGNELSEKLGKPVRGFDVFVETARGGGFESREWTYVRKDGTQFAVELVVTGIKDHTGSLTGFMGLATDISGRKRAELEMRKLAAAVRSSPTSIIITGREGLIEYANPKFQELTGYSENELLGQNPSIISSGKTPKATYEELWHTLLDGREWNGELLNRKKNGDLFWENASISPVKDALGGITNFIAVKLDITDRKLAQQEIEKARDAALELARMKSDFLANMSHEIRTPMNAIIGMTGLLLDTPLTEQQKDYVKTVNGAGDALLDLINEILDFSKIESGKLIIEKLDFDLRETVESTADLLASRAQAKQLELAYFVEDGVPAGLRGDPGRLRQVLLNLLGNSLKFTEAGEVVLTVSTKKKTEDGVVLRFSVKDTGIGIPPETQKKLFQVFTQADASTTRKYGGTGLGLSISKKLVELMGGSIGLASAPGEGSTFWFTLPFEKRAGTPPVGQAAPDMTAIRTLIVDDNAANREIISRYLEAWRMRFEAVASGSAALKALKREAAGRDPFRLVLLDMQMPGMDGLMLARSIHGNPAISSVGKVMMTSLGHAVKTEELDSAGITACLSKPVRPSALLKALSSALAGPAAAAPAAEPAAAPEQGKANRYFRVLVAEDNIVNQKVAVRQLEKLGYAADVAADGLEAIEALKRIPYDLVLMDCQMPEMDGFQATSEIRRTEEGQGHTPIVAMTANAMEGDREKCMAAGMDGYIPKPVRIETLAEILKRWDTPLNMAVVKYLGELAGPENPDFLKELLETYLKDMPGRLEAVREAVRSGDAKALQAAAHALKGSSANLGAQRLQKICLALEYIGREKTVEGAAELLEDLQKEAASVKAEMEILRGDGPRP